MGLYFRMQGKGHSLEAMQQYRSEDGASENETHEGLCACDSVSEMQRYAHMWFGEGDEIVIFRGRKVADLYDGVQVYPTEIVERVSLEQFLEDEERFFEMEAEL